MPHEQPLVSVLVPTYQREDALCETITDLLAQAYPTFEIVIVDQTSSHTPRVREYLERLPATVRYIKLATPNLPAARNEGIRNCRGSIIIFVDDDIRAPADFISAHVRNYDDPTVMAVAGAVLGEERAYSTDWPRELNDRYLRTFHGIWNFRRRTDVTHARGANHSFRREVPDIVGYFDEQYTGSAMREESDFYFRVSRHGFRIVYDPTAWLVHVPPQAQGGCWTGHDGIPSTSRFYNHAYFVMKNMPRHQWLRMFLDSLWSTFRRRESLAHGLRNFTKLKRVLHGWYLALRRQPWSRVGSGAR